MRRFDRRTNNHCPALTIEVHRERSLNRTANEMYQKTCTGIRWRRASLQRAVLWGLATLAFLLASFTSNHYWDEYFYLYSVRHHSPLALLTMESVLAEGLFPYGFFTAKFGFVTFLWALVSVTGDGPLALAVIRLVFAGLTVGLAAASYQVVRCLNDEKEASATALVLLFLPVSLYLGFKTLSEVPSLLLATIASWQFLASFRAESSRAVRARLLLAAVALALASLFRFTTGIFFGGLVLALLAVPDERFPRRAVIARAAAIVGLHVVLAGLVYAAFVGLPIDRFEAMVVSVTERQRGLNLKVYAVALTLQLFALPVAVALLGGWTRSVKLVGVWLAACMVPVLAASHIEPRYFYMGLLPLAMLAAAGLRIASARLRLGEAQGWLILGVLLVVFNRIGFVPLMPYEINEKDYARLMRMTEERQPGGTYLIPWLADYCYLAFTFPERVLVLTMSRTSGKVSVFETPEFRRWVGTGRYSGSLEALLDIPQPWIYVGWTYNPTILTLKERLRWLRIGYLEGIESRERLMNHLAQSWIWGQDHLRLGEIAVAGRYYGFQVVR